MRGRTSTVLPVYMPTGASEDKVHRGGSRVGMLLARLLLGKGRSRERRLRRVAGAVLLALLLFVSLLLRLTVWRRAVPAVQPLAQAKSVQTRQK